MVGAIRTRYVSPTQKERLANLSSTMLALKRNTDVINTMPTTFMLSGSNQKNPLFVAAPAKLQTAIVYSSSYFRK